MTTKQTHASVKPVVVTVRIPAELHQRLSQAAHSRGMSQSLLIAQAIEEKLNKGPFVDKVITERLHPDAVCWNTSIDGESPGRDVVSYETPD